MSSVLARKRGISTMEFYKSAVALRDTLTKALMNESIVPKRWRPVFTFPIIDLLKDLFGHLIAANNIYPNSPERVAARKQMQRFALDDLERIDDQLQYLLSTLYYGKIDADHNMPAQLEAAGDLIDHTDMLIKSWRKSTKLIAGKDLT